MPKPARMLVWPVWEGSQERPMRGSGRTFARLVVRALEPGPLVGRCSGPGLLCRALEIDRTLKDGAARARAIATPIMTEIKKQVGFIS